MNGHVNGSFSQLPDEMFNIIKAVGQSTGPRLGRLALPGRNVIDTPHYLANTSRGVVPHITQDTFTRDTHINGVYVALEDFIDKAPRAVPPLYKFKPKDGSSPLRRFIALPEDPILVLGARRAPPVEPPPATSNTDSAVAICTAVGFRYVKADDYSGDTEALRPDILVALGDVPYGRALGNKRVEKATDRNIRWLQDHIALRENVESDSKASQAKLFASLLPVACAKQQYFIGELVERLADHISGLAFYNMDTVDDLPEQLEHLPRLGFTSPKTPQEILCQIRRGLDILVVPFVGAATDAGIALDFTFGQTTDVTVNGHATDPLPLGIDMWSSTHAVDVSPLSHDCECYACTNHHRAYVQHLLAAKEMLGWVLLQIHNHHVMEVFFRNIRSSIANGTFEQHVETFERRYESRLPAKTGQGPRVRGYQFKSEGPGEPKKNPSAFRTLDDGREKLAEAALPPANADADDLQDQGFAEKGQ